MKKILLSLFTFFCVLATANAETYTHTFKNGELTTTGGTVTLSDIEWNATDATLIGWNNTKGIQFGSKESLNPSYTLSTSGFAGYKIKSVTVNSSIAAAQSALAQQNYSNQIASLERSYAAQTAQAAGFNGIQSQLAQCCGDNRLGTESLRATVLQENCADRYEAANNTRDIIESQTRSTQAILDKMCQDKIDAKNDLIAQLRSELIYARGQASQDVQTARILAGQTSEVDALYNRLSQCPIPCEPVYGRQAIFTCNNNNGCGCGCGMG